MNRAIESAEASIGKIVEKIQRSTYLPVWHASVFRIVFGFFLLLFDTPYYGWMSGIPDSLFNPPLLSVSRLFSGFPSDKILFSVDILAVLLIICITVGICSRISGFIFVFIYLVGSSFQYSFGKIDHTIMVIAALLCFSFSNWGTENALIPDKRWSLHSLSSSVLAVLISFGMFTAGFEKLLYWVDLDLSTNGFLSWFYSGYFNLGRQYLLADIVFGLPRWLLELMDYSAVLLELSPFACLLAGERFWKSWVLVACLFHLANTCLLNITFIVHIPVYLAFFLYPLPSRVKLENAVWLSRLIRFIYIPAALIGSLHIALRLGGKGVDYLVALLIPLDRALNLWFVAALWLCTAILGFLSLLSCHPKRREYAKQDSYIQPTPK